MKSLAEFVTESQNSGIYFQPVIFIANKRGGLLIKDYDGHAIAENKIAKEVCDKLSLEHEDTHDDLDLDLVPVIEFVSSKLMWVKPNTIKEVSL